MQQDNDPERGAMTAARVVEALEQSTRALEAATRQRNVSGSHHAIVGLLMLIFGAITSPHLGWVEWLLWLAWTIGASVLTMAGFCRMPWKQ